MATIYLNYFFKDNQLRQIIHTEMNKTMENI